MQDIRELDARGIPGGFVASEPFKTSADSHAKSLGFDADGVFVTHPIQDRTNDELGKLAERYFNDIFKLVFGVD